MRRASSAAASVVLSVLAVATLPSVVAAQSVTGDLIRQLNRELLYLAVPIAVLVEVILFYAVWRFRDSDEPQPTRNNRELEITWTVATGLVLLFVGTASFAVLANPQVAATPGHGHGNGFQPGAAPANATEVVVVTEQWNYTVRYPDANVTDDVVVVPVNRTVYLYTTSRDVIHSVHAPALGLKQDAFPGQYNVLQTRILSEGTYRLYCAEYCGDGHATMRTTIRAVSPEEYQSWLAGHENFSANATAGSQVDIVTPRPSTAQPTPANNSSTAQRATSVAHDSPRTPW